MFCKFSFPLISLVVLFSYGISCEVRNGHFISINEPTLNEYTVDELANLKYCRYRDDIYPLVHFNKIAGFGCYSYGPPTRFNEPPHFYRGRISFMDNKTYVVYYSTYVENNETKILFYDYTDTKAAKIISTTFKTEKYFNKWLECSMAAEQCCLNEMTNDNIIPSSEYCPVVWDAWNCFSQAKTGTTEKNSCPNYIYVSDAPCKQRSQKDCLENGIWNSTTDYETCQFLGTIRSRHIFHVNSLYVSIVVCLPAIFIFFYYPSLRVMRVILHRNLLISIIVKDIFVIMSKMLITIDAMDKEDSVLLGNDIACRVLAFFERVSVNAMYACMLVDGFYLHKLIVAVFRKDPSIFILYCVIAALSFIPILIWACFKAVQDNVYCWVVDESWRQWIIDSSRYAMLGVNLILLLDIIRVLIWKLKRNSGTQHAKTTLRATFILLPLFGIQFIMMSQRPVDAPCYWDNVFYYISYTMDSSQGIMVSIFYCYFNKEVQDLLKRSYEKTKTQVTERFNIRRPTFNMRRTTAATYVPESSVVRPSTTRSEIQKIVEDNNKEKVQDWLQTKFENTLHENV